MHINRGAPASRYESGGHSTNFVKLYRKASLTGYSAPSSFCEKALGAASKKSQQAMRPEMDTRRIWRESTPKMERQQHRDLLSLRFRSQIFIIEICIRP